MGQRLVDPLAILAALALALALASVGDEPRHAARPEAAGRPQRSALAAELERTLEPLLASGNASLEPSCPPPALLACRPEVRFYGELSSRPSPHLQRRVGAVVHAALRRDGFRRLQVRVEIDGGRIVSGLETLARWQISAEEIEIVTGGLELDR